MKTWRWIRHGDQRLYDIGINYADGSLHNPNGYPEDEVRAAIAGADQRRHERASAGAKKAAETRRRRQEKRVYEVVRGLRLSEKYGPRSHRVVCRKALEDPVSIERGIGSDCWQGVMRHITEHEATTGEAMSETKQPHGPVLICECGNETEWAYWPRRAGRRTRR